MHTQDIAFAFLMRLGCANRLRPVTAACLCRLNCIKLSENKI